MLFAGRRHFLNVGLEKNYFLIHPLLETPTSQKEEELQGNKNKLIKSGRIQEKCLPESN